MHRKRVEKSPPSPKQRPARRVDWAITLQFLLLSSITFALYARGLVNGFVTDDEKEVLRDPLIRNLADIPRLFAHSVWYFAGVKVENYYRPLKLVAYAVEYQMFGFWAAGWHLASALVRPASDPCRTRRLGGRRPGFVVPTSPASLPLGLPSQPLP